MTRHTIMNILKMKLKSNSVLINSNRFKFNYLTLNSKRKAPFSYQTGFAYIPITNNEKVTNANNLRLN